eukprot:Clim_evm5s48 gene=Clim_evmTU5s48
MRTEWPKKEVKSDKPAGPVKALAIDLDETLLDKGKQISEKNREAVRRAHFEHNVRIILASGRALGAIRSYEDCLGKDLPVDLVSFNGAQAHICRSHDSETGHREIDCVWVRPVPEEVRNRLLDWADKHKRTLNLYYGDKILVSANLGTAEEDALRTRYTGITKMPYTLINDYQSVKNGFGDDHLQPHKILVLCPDEERFELHRVLLEEVLNGLETYTVMGDFFIEVLHPDTCKGNGLKALVEAYAHEGITVERVAAFGDGLNDVEFIDYAGYGVAMGNAKQELKDAADWVSEKEHDEDAIAHEIERLIDAGALHAFPHDHVNSNDASDVAH